MCYKTQHSMLLTALERFLSGHAGSRHFKHILRRVLWLELEELPLLLVPYMVHSDKQVRYFRLSISYNESHRAEMHLLYYAMKL